MNTEFEKQKEKFRELLNIAEDLLDDGVNPDDIVEYLDGKKHEITNPILSCLFSEFLSANMY